MTDLDVKLQAVLDARKQKGRYRTLREYDTSSHSGLVDFSSNDYLSLTTSQTLRRAYLDRLASSPSILGSTGSRLLSGSSSSHTSIERRLAAHFISPSALLFNSGWDANVSFFSTVPQPGDWVVYDELVHASVHSGLRASRVDPSRKFSFGHNDPEALRAVLQRITSDGSTVFLALESLYSMDGDMSPLTQLLDLLDEHVSRRRQCVVLDEAHTTGTYGPGGRGMAFALGEAGGDVETARAGRRGIRRNRVGVRLMTFGKAVGCSGAVLLCSEPMRSFLINFARPFIYSTAMPHSTVIALECAWDVLQGAEGDQRRAKLSALMSHLHNLLTPLLERTPSHILRLPPSVSAPLSTSMDAPAAALATSPILGLLTPKPHALSAYLLEKGFVIRPVVPPTVPLGGERVRICLRAGMDEELLARLGVALEDWVGLQIREEKDASRGGAMEPGVMAIKARL